MAEKLLIELKPDLGLDGDHLTSCLHQDLELILWSVFKHRH